MAHTVFHNVNVSPTGTTGVGGADGNGHFQTSYDGTVIVAGQAGSLNLYDLAAAATRLRAIGSGLK